MVETETGGYLQVRCSPGVLGSFLLGPTCTPRHLWVLGAICVRGMSIVIASKWWGGYQGKITWERQRSLGVNSSLLMPVSTALTLYSATSAAATTPCGVSHLNTFEPDKGGWRGRWYAYVPAP